MRAMLCSLAALLTIAMTMPAAVAQQGHPLVGIWSGDWGPTSADRQQVLIELNWQDTTLSGIVNPGYDDAAPIKVGALDSTNWTVHLEAEGKDEKGPFRIIVDGQIDNLGSPNRSITGKWTRGNTTGTFKVTRE